MSKSHSFSASVVSHNPNVWLARCGNHAAWDGPTYEAVEDAWRQHVHEETGVAPRAFGDTAVERWAAS